MRDKVHFRYRASHMDLTGDFRYKKEMLKGSVKKIYQRDTRRRLQREASEEIKSIL